MHQLLMQVQLLHYGRSRKKISSLVKCIKTFYFDLIVSDDIWYGVTNLNEKWFSLCFLWMHLSRICYNLRHILRFHQYHYFSTPWCTCFGSTYTKIGTIQRRLAWPLRKDDTQNREAFHIFGSAPSPSTIFWMQKYHFFFKLWKLQIYLSWINEVRVPRMWENVWSVGCRVASCQDIKIKQQNSIYFSDANSFWLFD